MKIRHILACILLVAVICSMMACSSENAQNVNNPTATVTGDSKNKPAAEGSNAKKASSNSTPENDTDAGLKVVKIDTAGSDMTAGQKAVIEYFDADYLHIFNYEAMRRYPQIFDGSQVNVSGVVLKVLSMDSERYQLVIWMGIGSPDIPVEALPNEYKGAYLLLSGKTGEEWFMEGDILDVYGRNNGVESVTVDGVSYTIPQIEVQRAYRTECNVRGGIIFATFSDKFDLPFIKQVANAVLGEDIEIRKPVVGTDVPEEDAMLYDYLGQDVTEKLLVVELENQSNAKFTRFLFSKEGGSIRDIKDAMADYDSGYRRYFEFAPDFQHYFLFTYDQGLEILTLEYYDTSFNKIWKREFMETTSAQYDYTKNNIYLTANNELYIINTETGEDTYPPVYVGNKTAIRKLSEGVLMISDNKSDGVMMANPDGSIKWKTNLENNVDSVEGLQIVDNRIVFNYSWSSEDSVYSETYVAIDRESGDILVSATPSY